MTDPGAGHRFDAGAVRAWIADDVDADDAAQLQALLDADDAAAHDELAARFAATLGFGTAGLRGPLRAGPNGMNATVVRRAAAGLAVHLRDAGAGAGSVVVVGYDARYRSHEFAHDSAAVFAAAGFDAVVLPSALPTPLLAFAVRHLGAVAGVMVTASHNPPQDNGYKVYGGDGVQIVAPADALIEAAIRAVAAAREVPLDTDAVRVLDDGIVADYIAGVVDAVTDAVGPAPASARELRIVHTALHGVGTDTVLAVLHRGGFADITPVERQERPDPDFPTVAFPNPEEPGAIDLALELARERGADIVIANDPDADRCAVAVPDADGRWRMLRGDEVGVLLADALLQAGRAGTYATTIVSSSMLAAMTARHGAAYAETLTGFKWIARAAPDLAFGYEEALGYAVAPQLVADKDGMSAALLVAHIAARARDAGTTLLGRLDELAAQFGRYATDQVSVRVEDLRVIADTMARLRARPPATLLGEPVEVDDLLPDADVLRWRWPGGRVVVRPSGTEPKLKAYLEVIEPSGSAQLAAQAVTRLRDQVAALVGA